MAPAADHPLISIVIPVFNREGCLLRTLDSVAAQTLRPLRVIIVDNNSTDRSADIAIRWAEDHRTDDFTVDILYESKQGASAARNRGLREVTSPWMMFFDSDDVMEPDHLQRISEAIETNSDADLIGWDVSVEYAPGKKKQMKFPQRNILWNHLIHSCLGTQRYAAKTSLFRSVGKWDEQLSVWDDYELGVRIMLRLPVIHILKGSPRVSLNYSPDSLTASTLKLRDGELSALRALDAAAEALYKGNRADMLKWIELRRIELAAELRGAGLNDLARRIVREVAGQRGLWYRFIYLKHRFYPRGTYFMLRGRK